VVFYSRLWRLEGYQYIFSPAASGGIFWGEKRRLLIKHNKRRKQK
jgi:hypothetical protein